MRILFMGTPQSAVTVLKALMEAGEEIVAVVTQPDRPKGRHLKLTPSPVKELALKHNLKAYQPENLNYKDIQEDLRSLKPDLIVVTAYGKILPKEILNVPRHGCLNVHLSLLPKYRGASPVQGAILHGERETGVTIMHMDEHLDTGDIIRQEKVKIEEEDTAGSLEERLSKVGAEVLVKVIADLKKGPLSRRPQDHSQATYASSLLKEDGIIDWAKDGGTIHNQIRAMNPWPSAFTHYKGRQLKILKSKVHVINLSTKPAPAGKIVELVKGEGFIVATGKGHLLVTQVQPQDKKKMKASDFVHGYRVSIGDLLE